MSAVPADVAAILPPGDLPPWLAFLAAVSTPRDMSDLPAD